MAEMKDKQSRDPRLGKEVSSPVSTGGGGALFQARTQALYLANMLTGLPTVAGLSNGLIRSIRFEARYTGAHTDDIYCDVEGANGDEWRCFVQCKRTFDVVESDEKFKDALHAAWRDWLAQDPFSRVRDVLSIASSAPASPSLEAAREVCALARASSDVTDFLSKLNTPKLKSKKVRDAWAVFCALARPMLETDYSEAEVFRFTQCLRLNVHDVGSGETQEMVLLSSLLGTWCSQPELGDLFCAGLVEYCLEMGQKPGTATADSWRLSASNPLRAAFDAGQAGRSGISAVWGKLTTRARHQLSLISATLPNGMHVDRPALQAELLRSMEEHSLVVISGGAGVGKSSALATAAPKIAGSSPVLFFRADELDASSLDAALVSTGVTSGVLVLDAALQANERVVLVIDSLEKALEFSKRGALEELLGLAAKHKSVRLVVTARSHSVLALVTHFLHHSRVTVVDVPPLTDDELLRAMTASSFLADELADERLRRVLRFPFYLRLAVAYRESGRSLVGLGEGELRRHLWQEGVAPASGGSALSQRRRRTFDEICFQRAKRLSQFVEPPDDAEAVNILAQDGILVSDSHGRVGPAHDVFEDWSLYFRVEKEVAQAEHDWDSLFRALGTHSGLRRAFRMWTAEQADVNNADALSLLEYCITTSLAPALWRDEAMIGLLRSHAAERLIQRFEAHLLENEFKLLKRLVHLLRVACKGPAASQGAPFDDSEAAKEVHLRTLMTTPVGESWLHAVRLLDKHKSAIPDDSWPWVVALLEDAFGGSAWYEPTNITRGINSIADFYLSNLDEHWSRGESLGKRVFRLFICTVASRPDPVKKYIDAMIDRVTAARDNKRDIDAEEQLGYALTFLNSAPLSAVLPETVYRTLTTLYVGDEDKQDRYGAGVSYDRARSFGFRNFGVSPFFPASGMSGPFRHLLQYRYEESISFVVSLANDAAVAFKSSAHKDEVIIIPAGRSPSGVEHLHAQEFWLCYRGLSNAGEMLASALMALEERLLCDADQKPTETTARMEWLLEHGTSTLTTAVVASVMTAYPLLLSEKLAGLFRCSEFFFADRRRRVFESPLAVNGGNDGLDRYRQQERADSNRRPHRKVDLEGLMLQLQFESPSHQDLLFSILDEHNRALASVPATEQDDTWRLALKRMDLRGLKVGPQVGDGPYYELEIAKLDEDLVQKSNAAQERLAHVNRRAGLELWAGSASGRQGASEFQFSTPVEVLETLRLVHEQESDQEANTYSSLDHKVAAALVLAMFGQDATCDAWALDVLLEPSKSLRESSKDTWSAVAHALIALLTVRPIDSRVVAAVANIAFVRTPDVRFILAEAVNARCVGVPREFVQTIALGFARHAQLLDKALARPWNERQHGYAAADRLARHELKRRFAGVSCDVPELGDTPSLGTGSWVAALVAASGLADWEWRHRTLYGLINSATTSEDRSGRGGMDFESRYQLVLLFASELLRKDAGGDAALVRLKSILLTAPKFCSEVLRRVLLIVDADGYKSAERLWVIWDETCPLVFEQESLRRGYSSPLDEVLRALLLVGTQWRDGVYHVEMLDERPSFVPDCLRQVGDTRLGLQGCLELMTKVGRQSAIPDALLALRDAIAAHGTAAFADRNNQWNAEIVCRVAVHQHRDTLLRNRPLRDATLDMLEGLVDAGSSIAFQLRDYLATTGSTA